MYNNNFITYNQIMSFIKEFDPTITDIWEAYFESSNGLNDYIKDIPGFSKSSRIWKKEEFGLLKNLVINESDANEGVDIFIDKEHLKSRLDFKEGQILRPLAKKTSNKSKKDKNKVK